MAYLLSIITSVICLLAPKPTPFDHDLWKSQLEDYHDKDFVLDGNKNGYDVGVGDLDIPKQNRTPYLPLIKQFKIAIAHWLVKRVNKGYILGPFRVGEAVAKGVVDSLHCSPLFAVFKPKEVDYIKQVRPIQHLSYPKKGGISVNDLIDDSWKRVSYTSFKEVVRLVQAVGKGGYIWTIDLQDAYYRLPVKKKYWHLMGIKWCGFEFVFTSLQMGLASACNVYTRFADSIQHILYKNMPNPLLLIMSKLS